MLRKFSDISFNIIYSSRCKTAYVFYCILQVWGELMVDFIFSGNFHKLCYLFLESWKLVLNALAAFTRSRGFAFLQLPDLLSQDKNISIQCSWHPTEQGTSVAAGALPKFELLDCGRGDSSQIRALIMPALLTFGTGDIRRFTIMFPTGAFQL